MRRRDAAGGLVYSTEAGRMCPVCRQPLAQCRCGKAALPPVAGPVRVSREVKGRGGKTVTVVRGLPLDSVALADLGKQLRSACGAGGTVKDGTLEVQGDHAERVLAWLAARGFQPKRSGG